MNPVIWYLIISTIIVYLVHYFTTKSQGESVLSTGDSEESTAYIAIVFFFWWLLIPIIGMWFLWEKLEDKAVESYNEKNDDTRT